MRARAVATAIRRRRQSPLRQRLPVLATLRILEVLGARRRAGRRPVLPRAVAERVDRVQVVLEEGLGRRGADVPSPESKFVFEAPYLAQIGIVRADSLIGAHLYTRS